VEGADLPPLLKRAGLSQAELAQRLPEHGLEETEVSIANKLSRDGTVGCEPAPTGTPPRRRICKIA
jgi:hypothetical protein